MSLLQKGSNVDGSAQKDLRITKMLKNASLEVMPRTLQGVDDVAAIMPKGSRIYIAHIDGVSMDDMVSTARRLADAGFEVMPHIPARSFKDKAMLTQWVARYQGEAGVEQALVLAGGIAKPAGEYSDSMQLLESGVFDKAGFKRLHVAGHPEGSKDIDPKGGDDAVMAALQWKQAFSERSDAAMALVTQFAFDGGAMVDWARKIKEQGIDLPIHLGLCGPTKLQTLIKFSMACGVGPSLRVLHKRALDMRQLLKPFEPSALIDEVEMQLEGVSGCAIEQLHFFPLGGIKATSQWIKTQQNNGASHN